MKALITLIPGSFGRFSRDSVCLSASVNFLDGTPIEDIPEKIFDLTNNPNKETQNPWPRCRSLSVSDIVVVAIEEEDEGEAIQITKAWICEGMGWRKASVEDIGKRLLFNGRDSQRFAAFR